MKWAQNWRNEGFVLITTMMMLSVLAALLGAYMIITKVELATTKSTKDSMSGFYASEAGLNIRADIVRQIFVGYNRPTGVSPTSTNPCTGSNLGSGDYACASYSFDKRSARTYIQEDAGNPVVITVPPGERYQNLNAQEYRYTSTSQAINSSGATEALLDLRFKSRLVPLFQFAAFYNKDLEILPGPAMTLAGPVHTNGDLYLNANTSLDIAGQVTTAGALYRGRKDNSTSPNCSSTPVRVMNPTTALALIPSCPSRTLINQTQVNPYNGMIQFGVQPVTVPAPEILDPTPSAIYFNKADLRLVLKLNGAGIPDTSNSTTGVEVHSAADVLDSTQTSQLQACTGSISGRPIGTTLTMYNFREAKTIRMLEVDTQALMNCLYTTNWMGTGKRLDDATEGGLVFHFSVSGPNSNAVNNYGVRLRNASRLRSSNASAPIPRGLTVVSNQATYLLGAYNSLNKIPAAVLADSLNLLSNAWNDTNSNLAIGSRVATPTIYNAAFLAGTDSTGGIEGSGGQSGYYNGGLENYPRMHENWTSQTMTYRGSFVSLNTPRHVNGRWSAQSYNPPPRDWNYDTSFNNAANLPPITPRFVYLRQELFVRKFDL